jgi:hypothetical protein
LKPLFNPDALHKQAIQLACLVSKGPFGWKLIILIKATYSLAALPEGEPMKAAASSSSTSRSSSPASPKGAAPTPKGAAPTPKGAAPTPKGAAPTPKGAAPTPKGAAPTPKGAAPKANCYASDAFEGEKLRKEIAKQSTKYFSGYGVEVKFMNGFAQLFGAKISPCTAKSIMDDLKAVKEGKMSWSEAHIQEAFNFRRDFRQSIEHGDYAQAAAEGLGAVLNLTAGIAMSMIEKKVERDASRAK